MLPSANGTDIVGRVPRQHRQILAEAGVSLRLAQTANRFLVADGALRIQTVMRVSVGSR